QASPLFRGVFRLMDRDGDGKLYLKEVLAYLDAMDGLRQAVSGACASLTVTDQGQGLFDLVDLDKDGRLSVRELRQFAKLIDKLARAGAGALSSREGPRSYGASFEKGPASGGGGVPSFVIVGARFGTFNPPVRTEGPLWFRKMDRNRDGDV